MGKSIDIKKFSWQLFGVGLIFCYVIYRCPWYRLYVSDTTFLANRAYQMLDCIENNSPIFFYYNDFKGLGYGSSFFYGYLTLLPFLPILKYLGIDAFFISYQFTALLFQFIGVAMFAKRFTNDKYMEIGVLYLIQPLFGTWMIISSMFSFVLGCGMCFIFISKCIDFFRDRKSFIPACIWYFIIMNTHMISSLLGFVGCVFVLIFYFDKLRLKEYTYFCLLCIVLCLWNIFQVLYYFDSYMAHGHNINMLLDSSGILISSSLALLFMFGIFGQIFTKGVFVFNISCFLSCIWSLKRKKSLREKLVLLVVLGVVIFCFRPVFLFINDRINTVIQFPVRLIPFWSAVFLVICMRRVSLRYIRNAIFCSVIPLLLMFSLVPNKDLLDNVTEVYEMHGDEYLVDGAEKAYEHLTVNFGYIGNGEYLPSNMNYYGNGIKFPIRREFCNGDDENTYSYSYNSTNGVVKCDLSNNTSSTVEIGKLWYKGYQSNAGECFQTENGYVGVDVSGFSGELEVYYKYPIILQILFCIDCIMAGFILIKLIYDKYNKNSV